MKNLLKYCIILLTILCCSNTNELLAAPAVKSASERTIFNAQIEPSSEMKSGRVVLMVVFSLNSYNALQEKELKYLYDKYHKTGLDILLIPGKDKAEKETLTDGDILDQYTEFLGFTPIVSKPLHFITEGDCSKDPLFDWIENYLGPFSTVQEYSHKYLFSVNGKPAAWFLSSTKPKSKELVNEIEHQLTFASVGGGKY